MKFCAKCILLTYVMKETMRSEESEERSVRKDEILMQHQNDERAPMELSPQLVSIITTEHYTLQMGRSMTISEANGRASLFVGAVSSGLIALTFVGQISQLGTAFFLFSLVVIPTLFFMGLITFVRVMQSGGTDYICTRGINRLRHLYLEYAPQLQSNFLLPAHDDRDEAMSQEQMTPSWAQVFFNVAGMIAMINSVLIGSFVGLLLAVFALSLWVCTGMGMVVFLVSLFLHQRYQWLQWMRVERNLPMLFSRTPGAQKTSEEGRDLDTA